MPTPAAARAPEVLARALAVWCPLLAAAFANGAVRVVWLAPAAGERGAHVASALALSTIVAAVAWRAIQWIAPHSDGHAAGVGILWLALTLAFEFGAGHYLVGYSWASLLADYDVTRGRPGFSCSLTLTVSPLWVSWARGVLASTR